MRVNRRRMVSGRLHCVVAQETQFPSNLLDRRGNAGRRLRRTNRPRRLFHPGAELRIVVCFPLRVEQANLRRRHLVEHLLRQIAVFARLKRAQIRHLPISRRLDHVRIALKGTDREQSIVVRRLLVGRYSQPLVVWIKTSRHGSRPKASTPDDQSDADGRVAGSILVPNHPRCKHRPSLGLGIQGEPLGTNLASPGANVNWPSAHANVAGLLSMQA